MHLYDLARYRFLSTIRCKLPYLDNFCAGLELHYHVVIKLRNFYVGSSGLSFVAAVHDHFEHCAMGM